MGSERVQAALACTLSEARARVSVVPYRGLKVMILLTSHGVSDQCTVRKIKVEVLH